MLKPIARRQNRLEMVAMEDLVNRPLYCRLDAMQE